MIIAEAYPLTEATITRHAKVLFLTGVFGDTQARAKGKLAPCNLIFGEAVVFFERKTYGLVPTATAHRAYSLRYPS
jgi:hypothetical protein